MDGTLVSLLLIGFFAMFGLRELQAGGVYNIVLGAISVALAIAFIFGIARF